MGKHLIENREGVKERKGKMGAPNFVRTAQTEW